MADSDTLKLNKRNAVGTYFYSKNIYTLPTNTPFTKQHILISNGIYDIYGRTTGEDGLINHEQLNYLKNRSLSSLKQINSTGSQYVKSTNFNGYNIDNIDVNNIFEMKMNTNFGYFSDGKTYKFFTESSSTEAGQYMKYNINSDNTITSLHPFYDGTQLIRLPNKKLTLKEAKACYNYYTEFSDDRIAFKHYNDFNHVFLDDQVSIITQPICSYCYTNDEYKDIILVYELPKYTMGIDEIYLPEELLIAGFHPVSPFSTPVFNKTFNGISSDFSIEQTGQYQFTFSINTGTYFSNSTNRLIVTDLQLDGDRGAFEFSIDKSSVSTISKTVSRNTYTYIEFSVTANSNFCGLFQQYSSNFYEYLTINGLRIDFHCYCYNVNLTLTYSIDDMKTYEDIWDFKIDHDFRDFIIACKSKIKSNTYTTFNKISTFISNQNITGGATNTTISGSIPYDESIHSGLVQNANVTLSSLKLIENLGFKSSNASVIIDNNKSSINLTSTAVSGTIKRYINYTIIASNQLITSQTYNIYVGELVSTTIEETFDASKAYIHYKDAKNLIANSENSITDQYNIYNSPFVIRERNPYKCINGSIASNSSYDQSFFVNNFKYTDINGKSTINKNIPVGSMLIDDVLMGESESIFANSFNIKDYKIYSFYASNDDIVSNIIITEIYDKNDKLLRRIYNTQYDLSINVLDSNSNYSQCPISNNLVLEIQCPTFLPEFENNNIYNSYATGWYLLEKLFINPISLNGYYVDSSGQKLSDILKGITDQIEFEKTVAKYLYNCNLFEDVSLSIPISYNKGLQTKVNFNKVDSDIDDDNYIDCAIYHGSSYTPSGEYLYHHCINTYTSFKTKADVLTYKQQNSSSLRNVYNVDTSAPDEIYYGAIIPIKEIGPTMVADINSQLYPSIPFGYSSYENVKYIGDYSWSSYIDNQCQAYSDYWAGFDRETIPENSTAGKQTIMIRANANGGTINSYKVVKNITMEKTDSKTLSKGTFGGTFKISLDLNNPDNKLLYNLIFGSDSNNRAIKFSISKLRFILNDQDNYFGRSMLIPSYAAFDSSIDDLGGLVNRPVAGGSTTENITGSVGLGYPPIDVSSTTQNKNHPYVPHDSLIITLEHETALPYGIPITITNATIDEATKIFNIYISIPPIPSYITVSSKGSSGGYGTDATVLNAKTYEIIPDSNKLHQSFSITTDEKSLDSYQPINGVLEEPSCLLEMLFITPNHYEYAIDNAYSENNIIDYQYLKKKDSSISIGYDFNTNATFKSYFNNGDYDGALTFIDGRLFNFSNMSFSNSKAIYYPTYGYTATDKNNCSYYCRLMF